MKLAPDGQNTVTTTPTTTPAPVVSSTASTDPDATTTTTTAPVSSLDAQTHIVTPVTASTDPDATTTTTTAPVVSSTAVAPTARVRHKCKMCPNDATERGKVLCIKCILTSILET